MTRQDVDRAFHAAHWGNTTETPEKWLAILASDDDEARFRIFEKLFREDPRGDDLRALFAHDEICRYLTRLKRPYRFAHQERRRLVWRSNYLDIPAVVPELDWVCHPKVGS